MTPKQFQDALLAWFGKHGRRHLPWQQNINPYRVWVSEIMLQQTQVTTVIPYYERFMQRFPNVDTLSSSSLNDVLHHWTGLGYYARARNLHKAAQQIVSGFNGKFPDSVERLTELPGIGRSTAGAIRSIAFGKPAAILDGNVKRVLARYAAIEGWPGKTSVQKQLWDIAERYSPQKYPAKYTQAIMDLGATLCTKTSPHCNQCPIASACKACDQGKQHYFPVKKPKKEKPIKRTLFLLIRNQEKEVLLFMNPPVGLWGGLWMLPQVEIEADRVDYCKILGLKMVKQQALSEQRHTFSHFHLDYQIIAIDVIMLNNKVAETDTQVWYDPQKPLSLGMPAPIKALLHG